MDVLARVVGCGVLIIVSEVIKWWAAGAILRVLGR